MWDPSGIPGEGGSPWEIEVVGVNPAAGANYSVSLDANFRQRLLACVFTLTTDSNAANRYVKVEYQGPDSNAFCVNAAAVTVPASTTQRFAGQTLRGEAEWAANTDVLFPILPLELPGGTTLAIVVGGIQAGDTLTLIRFWFHRRWSSENPVTQA